MSGRLTIREATAAARSLGTFTRFQLADALGVTPLEVGGWLKRLELERELVRREGRTFHWDPAGERPEPEPPKHEGEDCRIVARRLGRFTIADFVEATGMSPSYAAKKIAWLVEHDVIRDSGKTEYREVGKRPVIYEQVPIASFPLPPKKQPVEQEVVARNGEVSHGTNWRAILRDEQLRTFAQAVESVGGTVNVHKHVIFEVHGHKVVTGKTPHPRSPQHKTAKKLRDLGVPV